MFNNKKCLKKVVLASDVYATCLQHAFTTEKEEIMGLLIGEADEKLLVSYVSACVILHRSDKKPDRVEISPEQLCTATTYADELAKKLKRPMRVLGWYHSHPHITVWPSHVDVRTQAIYQTMDPLFVGLIISVYQNGNGTVGNNVQITCFQAVTDGSEYHRKEIPIVFRNSSLQSYNLKGITSLPKILVQEEVQTCEHEDNGIHDEIVRLHNDAFKTIALAHIVSKVAQPLCDGLENRLQATTAKIKELEKLKKKTNK